MRIQFDDFLALRHSLIVGLMPSSRIWLKWTLEYLRNHMRWIPQAEPLTPLI